MENKIIKDIINNVNQVVVGKDEVIKNVLKGILCQGHILIEDMPGLGKTTLVKSIARTLGLTFSRIQFTPDLLPSDITGVSIYNPKDMVFEFRKGPIFSNVILADEINRTAPKTQSALLEVMEETQVSESGITYNLDEPFIVLATQNPIEFEGTFNLPEAQLDRFIMKIRIGYPSHENEVNILKNFRVTNPLDSLKSVVTKEEFLQVINEVKQVKVHEDIMNYIVDIANASRQFDLVDNGISPRASLALMRVSQAEAFINGRNFVIPDDVKNNAVNVLSHRIKLSNTSRNRLLKQEDVINTILNNVIAPQ